MRKDFLERNDRFYETIQSFIIEKHYPPSLRELMQHTDVWSTSTALHHIKTLEKRGLIKRANNKRRTIILVRKEK
ncbi:HTH domain-containing protein [Salmonella enterica]|nr:HTH domain-containing protein [Salmonella enterica]